MSKLAEDIGQRGEVLPVPTPAIHPEVGVFTRDEEMVAMIDNTEPYTKWKLLALGNVGQTKNQIKERATKGNNLLATMLEGSVFADQYKSNAILTKVFFADKVFHGNGGCRISDVLIGDWIEAAFYALPMEEREAALAEYKKEARGAVLSA